MVIRFDSKLTLQNGGSNTLNTKAASPALSLKIGDTYIEKLFNVKQNC